MRLITLAWCPLRTSQSVFRVLEVGDGCLVFACQEHTPTPQDFQVTTVVSVTWLTAKESKTDSFLIYRTTTLKPAAWALIHTHPSQSNCATITSTLAYSYPDASVVGGQTYYYQLAWSGDRCGGVGGSHPYYATTDNNPSPTPYREFLPYIQRGTPDLGKVPARATHPFADADHSAHSNDHANAHLHTPADPHTNSAAALTPVPSYALTPTRPLTPTFSYTLSPTRTPTLTYTPTPARTLIR